jgi:hypothetical protein
VKQPSEWSCGSRPVHAIALIDLPFIQASWKSHELPLACHVVPLMLRHEARREEPPTPCNGEEFQTGLYLGEFHAVADQAEPIVFSIAYHA